MKILVLGSGGREHALLWKLAQSARVRELHCAPGNGGICQLAVAFAGGGGVRRRVVCHRVDMSNPNSVAELAAQVRPDLTVVGPELPLTAGVVDEFVKHGWPIFGPSRAAAQLESSKSFAKEFMVRHHIPTAHYAVCTSAAELNDALAHLHAPVVVKADGLAAGKGVVIAPTKDEAARVAGEMLSGAMLGNAGRRVVLEEFLEGEEVSFLVIADGERVVPLAAARDHKRVGEGDTGPNTGGMGSFSAKDLLDAKMQEWLLAHVARPVVAGMKQEGNEYRGILYCGLMMTSRGPQVLEFNCRFGDPETQPILMRLESDLLEAFEAAVEGRSSEGDVRWSPEAAACVVLASRGYPDKPETGKKITGLDTAAAIEGVQVFHAGTSYKEGDGFYTTGGRVLGVTARGAHLRSAVTRAYDAVGKINFEGMHYRRDIAARAL